MKICIFGAGAIGGFMGARLARAGCEVSLVARGPHRAAINRDGLRLVSEGRTETFRLPCVEDARELPPQDYVVVALKAHSVAAVVEPMRSLFHESTAVVSAVNGVPWWYFFGIGGEFEGRRVAAVDPGGVVWNAIGPERAIGCVVHPSCEVTEPGTITHLEGDRFPLGEPSGEKTARVEAFSRALREAGLRAPVRKQIREEIWIKLWGNLSFNPISALTGATLDVLCETAGTRQVARAMMLEGQAIGEKLGARFPIDVDARIAGAQAVGAHKTSMLQDLERGRPLEIDALVGAVAELGRMVEVPTPTIDIVLALVRQRARTVHLD